jgi:chemotaxis protein MotD
VNALDALFSRQVPTKAPGSSASAAGRDRPGDQPGSFASALSGRSNKPDSPTRGADEKAPVSDDTVENPTETAEVSEDDTGADEAVDILELFGQRIAKDSDKTDPDKEKSDDEGLVEEDAADEEDIILLDEAAVTAQPPVQPKAEAAGRAGDELSAVAAQPKPIATAQSERQGKGEQSQVNNAAGATRGAGMDEALAGQGKASANTGGEAGSEQQARGKPDLSALDSGSGSVSASTRGEGDAAIDGVEVLDRRSVTSPSMSQNGENVAKALFREATGMTAAPAAEHAEASAARAAAATERANAAFMARTPGQTLQTLRIQLNPESLGQVTAVMRLSDGELQVELKVQNADAYRQLSDDSSSIAKALRAHGFGVDQITVQHVGGSDRSSTNPQQGQNASQQFQFREGLAQNAGGGNGNGGSRREQAAGSGQNLGELGHEAVSGAAGSSGRIDGMYL